MEKFQIAEWKKAKNKVSQTEMYFQDSCPSLILHARGKVNLYSQFHIKSIISAIDGLSSVPLQENATCQSFFELFKDVYSCLEWH